MGKSRLARAYVHEALMQGAYDAILWFQLSRDVDDVQNKSSLETQYREWFSSVREGIKKGSLENDLFNLFKNKISQYYKCPLIIYDDVPSGDFLRDLLPQANVHILVTSRDALGWKHTEMIPSLEGFQPEESVRFLQQESGRDSEEEKKDALKVANALGGIPLALEQAASWVRYGSTFSQYLTEFQTKAKELMKEKAEGSDYPYVIATTWTVTMKSLSQLARQLIGYFAYMNSENIPIDLFELLKPRKALNELIKYSLIKRNDDYISVHQLVQLVNRKEEVALETIKGLLNLFVGMAENLFQMDLDKWEQKERFLAYLPHMVTVYNYAKEVKTFDKDLFEKFIAAKQVLVGVRNYTRASIEGRFSNIHLLNLSFLNHTALQEEDDDDFEMLSQEEKVKRLRWISKISRGNHPQINFIIGILYHSVDDKEAARWLTQAVNQGCAYAQAYLGKRYEHGIGVEQNYEKAVKLYQEAADRGDTNGQTFLGTMYEFGKGVSRDEKKAEELYQEAAAKGNTFAQLHLSLMDSNKLLEKAVEALENLSTTKKDSTVLVHLGTWYEHGKGLKQDYKKAAEIYQKAADLGHAIAQCNLGLMHIRGEITLQDDKEAVEYLILAANQGEVIAQTSLGIMYEDGEKVSPNLTLAKKWYIKAANQGEPDAQVRLGMMYMHGKEVEQDYKKAAELYQKAADQENVLAQLKLGAMYQEGIGVPKNLVRAKELYQKAADQGSELGQQALSSLWQMEVAHKIGIATFSIFFLFCFFSFLF